MLRKIWFEAKIRGVKSVSGETIYDFHMFRPAKGPKANAPPAPPSPVYGLDY